MNHTGQWDIEFESYLLDSLKYGQEIQAFLPIWPSLIVKVLATRSKFLEPSGYYTKVNGGFTLSTTNAFGCFIGVIDQFKVVKQKFLN